MKVEVKLFATYREYLPAECKGKTVMEVEEGTTAVSLLTSLGVPVEESVVLVDGRTPNPDETLTEGVTVCSFSAVGGG
jgi:sulfur carrier protein ThiS